MLFNSLVFLFVFLPITYLVFWALRSSQYRYVWLAITGYVFYGYWDPRFCLLMLFSTLVSYFAGIGLFYATSPVWRKVLLIVPICVDLGLLGFFKYTMFAISTWQTAMESIGYPVYIPALQIVLPVGISFYTFHTITYIVDSYRRTIRPTRNVFEFAAYVSLFSQLVAGPIVRFRQIEEDLESLGSADRTRWLGKGVGFFLVGLLEKVLIADSLAAWVNPAIENYQHLSTLGVWSAMVGYSLQLYFDFCGYSDMAVGLGFMFGIRIPQNFDSPYKAGDPSDFWRRWHISLSTCLRDYLYIPLGGSRGSEWNTNRNLLLTMLIGGLWHGASWTFVVWGLYHGLLLIIHRATANHWERLPFALRQAAMLLLVVIGWVFFRATDFAMASGILGRMFAVTEGESPLASRLVALSLAASAALAIWGPNAFDIFKNYEWKAWHGWGFAVAFGMCLALIVGNGDSPFLYFQF